MLVHCRHGQSRSAAVVAAWRLAIAANSVAAAALADVAADAAVSPSAALASARAAVTDPAACRRRVATVIAWLQRCRPRVAPNEGFHEQLTVYASQVASEAVSRLAAEKFTKTVGSFNCETPARRVVCPTGTGQRAI